MTTKRQLRDRWKEAPGASIISQVMEFRSQMPFGHGQRVALSRQLFAILHGLPFREEVPSGRDFRGADFPGGVDLDLRGADFSYASSLGNFINCDLSDARFDQVSISSVVFNGMLNHVSFRKAKLQSCSMMSTTAHSCNFDGSNLKSMRFDNTDLSGSSFQNANCHGCCFSGANLCGCDFRGATLDNATFQDAKIDSTTDFRGASLINAFNEDAYNNAGVLVGKGVDLRIAKHDSTTRFGKDEAALELEVIDSACKIAPRFSEPGVNRIVQELMAVRARVAKHGLQDWQGEIIDRLAANDKELFEQIIDDAYRELL